MRELRHYRAGEWLRLRPAVEGARQWRNDLWLDRYTRRPAEDEARFLRSLGPLTGRTILAVIAFEQPLALEWLLRSLERLAGSAVPLVFDNSRDATRRAEIAALCARLGVGCLALPPQRTRHVNRSHGLAMTWVHRRILAPLQPAMFGFVDHDMILARPLDLTARLANQPCYGVLNEGRHGCWNLWAGYCFYRTRDLPDLPLNFLYDFSRGLDTGGRNWPGLYRRLDRRELAFAPRSDVSLTDPLSGTGRPVECVDGAWLHLGGAGYNDHFSRKQAFFAHLAERLASGDRLDDLAWQPAVAAA